MARRKKVAPTPALDRSHFVEDEARAGEKVRVYNQRGVFTVIREVLNTNTEAEWVEVWSPERQFRAFRPELVRPAKRRSA